MKVKWRSQEHLLVGFMAVLIALVGVSRVYYGEGGGHRPLYALLTIVNIALLYGGYLWLDRLIVPILRKVFRKQNPAAALLLVFGAAGQVIALAYLLGPVINFASYYWALGFRPFPDAPLVLGYHPQPFLNAFGGMNDSLLMILLFLMYALFRETSLDYIEKGAYRVLISNRVTNFLLTVLAAPLVFRLFGLLKDGSYYRYYFALIPPAGLFVLSNFYWLFPTYEGLPKRDIGFLGKLIFSALAYVLFFSIFLAEDWSATTVFITLLALLFVFSPLSWWSYQSQRERILHLRGVEKALSRSKADLQLLRSQINPHFLFNALNTLYATALIEKAPDTSNGIQQLGDMMRFMLEDNQKDLIPMSKELNYMENYIALQKLRTQTSPDILIEDNIGGQQCDLQIAPMLLIPFVENAFKHGISLKTPSWIKIKLTCDTNIIHFEVRNSLLAMSANDPETGRAGIGLENVKERLQLQYPKNHQFLCGPEGDEFVVALTIRTNNADRNCH